jgi:hypothetical protein
MRALYWFNASTRTRRAVGLAVIVLGVGLCAKTVNCVRDSRDLYAVRKTSERWPSGVNTESWPLCSLIGPHNQNAGIWGTDLGFSARTHDDAKLTLLFGDTWASPVKGCQYPPAPNNDLVATLPAQRPSLFSPGAPAGRSGTPAPSCDFLKYSHDAPNDVTSWRRARLFPNTNARRDDAPLDLSGLRTPTAAFSDGEKLFALFLRFDPALCSGQSDCPDGMQCSSDPEYHGLPVGECARVIKPTADAVPDYCRDADDCVPFADCKPAEHGVCLATEPFDIQTPRGRVAPAWYRDDPKRAVASIVYVAAAIWPDRPADYATVARFATNRFLNAAARSVAYFDPEHPEKNDYRPGYHTLLIWGRNSFVESGGAQALPFLLYVPLEDLRGAPEKVVWRPRFFAGYGSDGHPAWSERESDAKPIYGDQARLVDSSGDQLEWSEPEFDQVAQMSLSWVAPLSRWVMLYGGDLPAFMVMAPKTFKTRDPVNLQWAPGAIHMRVAEHPWGAARVAPAQPDHARDDTGESGWSSAKPVLTRELAAPYLACGEDGSDGLPGCVENSDQFRSFTLIGSLAGSATRQGFGEVLGSCLFGEAARAIQDTLSGNPIGRLYAPNILEEWTEDVTDAEARARGERSAEVYWNVSTWNPYQVVLFKTRLSSSVNAERASLRPIQQ